MTVEMAPFLRRAVSNHEDRVTGRKVGLQLGRHVVTLRTVMDSARATSLSAPTRWAAISRGTYRFLFCENGNDVR